MGATITFLRYYSRVRLLKKWAARRAQRPASLRFMGAFVRPGDMVFDIGANYGWKTDIFLALGARVVAMEPQGACLKVLRRKFKNDPGVTLVEAAAGAVNGTGVLYVSDVRNQLSSMSTDWIRAVRVSGRFRRFTWSTPREVRLRTLDSLIAEYGLPAFCKLDIEGYEGEALKGLTRAIPSLSIEYHVESMGSTEQALTCLDRLGPYRYRYTVGNRPCFEGPAWGEAGAVLSAIRDIGARTLQGDIYARRMA